MGGPTTGAMGSVTGATTSPAGPTTMGASSSGSGTTGSGTGNTTGSSTSNGGASSSTGGGPNTTGSSSGTGGTGGGGAGIQADCSPAEGEIPELTLTPVATVNVPVDLAYPPGDERLFVATLDGDVRVIKDGQVVETPFLSLGSKAVVGGNLGDERGLLGLAFHPDYADNGLFYVHYVAGQGVDGASTNDSVLEEYKVSADPDVADAASGRVVLVVEQPSSTNHKGGSIEFGADGLLYWGLGDGGGMGDAMGNAQNTSALLGKLLRIDPLESGGMPYSTPADNLAMTVSGAAPEIWDYGLRNPFRFSFDLCEGDLYIGDVGQNAYEEITIEKAAEGRKNYGWNIWEGLHCYPNGDSCSDDGVTQPLLEVPRAQSSSITGGSVYRGSAIPSLRGVYFYADYMSNGAWYTRYDRDANTAAAPTSISQELNVEGVVAIKNGADGELYFVSIGSGLSNNVHPEGTIYKLTAAP